MAAKPTPKAAHIHLCRPTGAGMRYSWANITPEQAVQVTVPTARHVEQGCSWSCCWRSAGWAGWLRLDGIHAWAPVCAAFSGQVALLRSLPRSLANLRLGEAALACCLGFKVLHAPAR